VHFLKILKIETSQDRVFGLDLLRALAIVMVMLLHGNSYLPPVIGKIIGFFIIDGVSIFFVLSGFLIGGIFIKLLKRTHPKEINLKFLMNFLMRRWLRTLPNYYLVLTIIILFFLVNNLPISHYSMYKYFLLFQNFSTPHPTFFPEAWSLAVEEWFYIIIPSLVIITYHLYSQEKIKNSLLTISFIVILSCMLLRFFKFQNIGITDDFDLNYKKIVILRLDSIIYGIIMAYLFFIKKELMRRWKNYFAILGLLILTSLHLYITKENPSPFFIANLSLPLESISTMLLLPYFYFLRVKNSIFKKIVVHISVISYSMYLFNYSLIKYGIIKSINWRALYRIIESFPSAHIIIDFLQYILFWVITIVISTLVYNFYEKPMLNFRDKITQ